MHRERVCYTHEPNHVRAPKALRLLYSGSVAQLPARQNQYSELKSIIWRRPYKAALRRVFALRAENLLERTYWRTQSDFILHWRLPRGSCKPDTVLGTHGASSGDVSCEQTLTRGVVPAIPSYGPLLVSSSFSPCKTIAVPCIVCIVAPNGERILPRK